MTKQNWHPVPHTIFRDEALADRIHSLGYAVLDFADLGQLQKLNEFYFEQNDIISMRKVSEKYIGHLLVCTYTAQRISIN